MAQKESFVDSLSAAYAMRQALRRGYGKRDLLRDFTAALVVSMVALPLAMALAIAVGLPPQHGIYTAIVAGIAAPLFGGSLTQVSGPTAAFVVIVAPIVEQYGLRGLIITEIMAGFMLIALAVARFGAYISYVPYPVTTGFTAGIAVVLATLSLNDFLGLHIASLSGEYTDKAWAIFQAIPNLHWPEAAVGLTTLAAIMLSRRVVAKIPPAVTGIAVGTLLAWVLSQNGLDVATIGSSFSYPLPGGGEGHGIPPYPPVLHVPGSRSDPLFAPLTYDELRTLVMPAMTIAALAALESLLSATVADGLAGTKHHPNAELLGIGLANIFSGTAAGIPATGAIARTATNIQNGARSPLACVFHALLIMLYVLLLAPAIAYVPMASLAAILLVVAYHMSHYKQFLNAVRTAPRYDMMVLLTCFGLTVFIDMVAGVTVGIVLASFLFMKRMVALTETEVQDWEAKGDELKAPPGVLIYRINGPLFFGTAEKALDRSFFTRGDYHTLVLDMEHVPMIDLSGLVAMESLLAGAAKEGKAIMLCCRRKTIAEKIMRKMPPSIHGSITVASSLSSALLALGK